MEGLGSSIGHIIAYVGRFRGSSWYVQVASGIVSDNHM